MNLADSESFYPVMVYLVSNFRTLAFGEGLDVIDRAGRKT